MKKTPPALPVFQGLRQSTRSGTAGRLAACALALAFTGGTAHAATFGHARLASGAGEPLLILVPVSLQRKSARSGFTLCLHDDEPRFNPTLIEMLRQDFDLSLGTLEGALPQDEIGLDVAAVWKIVGHAIKDIKGFSVVDNFTTGEELGVALPKGGTEIAEKVNSTLKRLTDDGTMEDLTAKWFGEK